MIDGEVAVEHQGLNLGETIGVLVLEPPAGLDQADARLIKGGNRLREEPPGNHEIGIEDRHELRV